MYQLKSRKRVCLTGPGINKSFVTVICLSARASEVVEELTPKQGDFRFSNCRIVTDQPCPYPEIKFYLYTRRRPEYPQPITIGDTIDDSNITKSDFDYRLPTKIIIHGYNSDMFLGALVEIKQREYYLFICNIGGISARLSKTLVGKLKLRQFM